MSFREKALWASLLLPAALWCWYFGLIGMALAGAAALDEGLFAARMLEIMVASIALQLASVAVLARRDPDPAFVPDEREQLFEYRGASRAYQVISIGILVVVAGNFLAWSRFAIVNAVVLIFLLSEAMKIGIELSLLRKGVGR